jgi:imidazole glycerol-phosphate synthase subunit HisH
MGWNLVYPAKANMLLPAVKPELRYYFVHSYHVVCEDQDDILAYSNYGYDFICAVQHDNVYGVQFHPEKSHRFGMALIKNFIEL